MMSALSHSHEEMRPDSNNAFVHCGIPVTLRDPIISQKNTLLTITPPDSTFDSTQDADFLYAFYANSDLPSAWDNRNYTFFLAVSSRNYSQATIHQVMRREMLFCTWPVHCAERICVLPVCFKHLFWPLTSLADKACVFCCWLHPLFFSSS